MYTYIIYAVDNKKQQHSTWLNIHVNQPLLLVVVCQAVFRETFKTCNLICVHNINISFLINVTFPCRTFGKTCPFQPTIFFDLMQEVCLIKLVPQSD